MKKALALILALAMVFTLAACGAKEEVLDPDTASASTYKVGIIFQDLSNEWIALERDAFMANAATKTDVEWVVLDGQGDPANQCSQVESLMAQKCDLIIVNPYDHYQVTPAIKSAIDAGFPVICLGTNCDEDLGQVFISSSNVVGGEIMMEYVCESIGGKGNIAILRGPNGNYSRLGRDEGYENILAKYPDVNVVFDAAADWSRELGMSTMENWLQTGTQIDAVVGQNDEMVLGALTAVDAAGKLDQIQLFGMDGIDDALNAVKDGKLKCTLFQDAVGVGIAVVDLAYAMLTGGEYQQETDVPFELVTIDNVDEYFARTQVPELG